jgi:dGTPase
LRRLIAHMIEDVIAETKRRLGGLGSQGPADVREAPTRIVGFSQPMAQADRAIKGFLLPRMYRHARVMRIMTLAEACLAELFARYLEEPQDLPPQRRPQPTDTAATRARQIADFIAGMTDRFALEEHARLFDSTPELR